MYKKDLALKDLKWLMCHKTRPNQAILIVTWYIAFHLVGNYMWKTELFSFYSFALLMLKPYIKATNITKLM